jgi:hypothetical protein
MRTVTHFSTKRCFSEGAGKAPTGHVRRIFCLCCELPDLLQDSMPPDPELVDLIEWAFLEGQIDGQKADLACWWLCKQEPVCAISY